MKDMSLRNVLLLLGAVIVALLALGLVSTILSQIIPVTIALVAGVVLGRMSVNVDVSTALMNIIRRRNQPATEKKPETKDPQPATDEMRGEVEAIKERIADKESQPEEKAEIADFDLRSEGEVLAEARRREAEIAQQSSEYDPAAALAERRRRLLGDQADD